MNKILSLIIIIVLFLAIGYFAIFNSKENTNLGIDGNQIKNVEIKEGIQYIIINAKGGYFPKVSNAKADIPTKIIIKTNNTYDCSLAFVIPSLKYQKMLPNKGITEIDIGVNKIGESIQGLCSMGMYSFIVNFL